MREYEKAKVAELSRKFVLERFSSATLIYMNSGGATEWPIEPYGFNVVLNEPKNVIKRMSLHSEYYSVPFSMLSEQVFLGKSRWHDHTAWKSAADEITKYESGKKQSIYLEYLFEQKSITT